MIVSCGHETDDDDTDHDNNTDTQETRDLCSLGTPVCLPAVVWFEDKQGDTIISFAGKIWECC